MADTPAPIPGVVDQSKQNLDALVKQVLAKASQPQMGMQQPRPQFSQESMTKQGFDNSHQTNKKADIGQALGNMGSLIHNAVAQHKQNQIREAMNEWDGFNRAIEKAQVLAGDPSAPDYQQKVQKALADDPFVKSQLDPANPKAVKRIKNMYKALNVDLLATDKENVHREGLKRFFKVQDAFKKVLGNKQKMDAQKQQGGQGGQQGAQQGNQQEQQQKQFQESLGKLAGQMKPPDPKGMEAAARLGIEYEKSLADNVQYMPVTKPDGSTSIVAMDKKVPPGQQPQAREVQITDAKTGKTGAVSPVNKGKPEAQLIKEGIAMAESGDEAGAQKKFALANKAALAGKVGSPTLMDMVIKKNQGDPQAAKDLASYMGVQKELQGAKGAMYALTRARYNLEQYVNPKTHQLETISAMDATIRINNGEHLIKTQSLPVQVIIGAQRLQKEGTPAIKEMRQYTKAFDNPKDRAIFAELAKGAGPMGEDKIGWMQTVLQQTLQQKGRFSEDGRQLLLREQRLAEVLGTARQSLGALATNSGVALAMGLMPSANMPDKKLADDSLDQLQAILENSLSTEALKDVTSGSLSDKPSRSSSGDLATSPEDFDK